MASLAVCARCRRPLSEAEIQGRGLLLTEHGPICAECAPAWRAAVGGVPRAGEAAAATPAPSMSERPTPSSPEAARPAEGQPAGPQPSEAQRDALDVLEEIRREVSQLRRSLTFEETSVWNVVGAVTQCFALAALAAAAVQWGRRPEPMLLLAVFLQVATLTLFFHGRR
jgi:hypothetical protein